MYRKSIVWFVLASLFIILTLLSGCQDKSEEVVVQTEETPKPEKKAPSESSNEPSDALSAADFKQSPMLDSKGLPPVQDRLPLEPKLTNEMTAEQYEYEIGTYGGLLRTVRLDPQFDAAVFVLQNEPLVNSPGLLGEEVTGNIVKGYETQDQMKFTFTMREGLRWSDGELVTIEDVQFAIEDVMFNEELTPGGVPTWLRASADATAAPMQFEVIDDRTFNIIFEKPYGAFPIQLAVMGWKGYTDLLKPKHFLQQYHTKYTPLEKLEPVIKEKGFEPGEWVNLFHKMDALNWEATNPEAIGFPVLTPYIQTKSGDVIEFERNPYYFKVDAAGNQLPYIDTVRSTLVQDAETITLKVLSGEVDHSNDYLPLTSVPLLKENEAKGGYKLYLNNLHRSQADFYLNLTYEDPVWREVVRDLRFRQALNFAMDKQEIADAVYYGLATPSDIQDTTYDVDAANKLLDDMGMKLGSDGYRLGPDGKRFSIPIEHGAYFPDFNPLGELLIEQWKEIGIHTTIKTIDNALFGQRNAANQLQATIIFSTPGTIFWPNQEWGESKWAPLWHRWWNTQGKEGEEPPAGVKEFYELVSSQQALSLSLGADTRGEVAQNMGENLWYFIPMKDIGAPVAVNKNIGNYSESKVGVELANNFGGEQWFYRK